MKFKNKEDYTNQRTALYNEAQSLIAAGNIDEANARMEDIKELDNEWETFAQAQANLNALNQPSMANLSNAVGTPVQQSANFGTENNTVTDKYNTIEYRNAFMNYVLHNTAAQTTTSEIASVIPTTVVNRIVEKLEKVGKIYNKVTKTAYKGGVTIPTSSAKPTASWVAERGTADTQEKTTGSITFAYRKLICKVAVSLETSIVSLEVFETTIVNNVTEAMLKAIETAIISGTGSANNQPSGILSETPATGQTIEITEGSNITYADLVDAEAAIPEAYENGAEWCMRKATYFNQVVGMTDTAGQPIARTNVGIDGKPVYTILGRPVTFSEDVPAFATSVTADTTVAFIFDFSDYMLNTNMALTVRKYTDEDTDDEITKAIMLVDGKVIDKNSLVKVNVKNS